MEMSKIEWGEKEKSVEGRMTKSVRVEVTNNVPSAGVKLCPSVVASRVSAVRCKQ
jgi:hypothetical protein